jgi:D-sedoheptulose 7-phosphate isomerase
MINVKHKNFFFNYFESIKKKLSIIDHSKLIACVDLIRNVKKQESKIIIIGNGGSAAIASHVAVDFIKTSRVRAVNFNEADLITCFANDYGYKNWVAQALRCYADPNDLIILISSSGKSKNIINAAKYAKMKQLPIITLSGFKRNNPLQRFGNINMWVNSKRYNTIEMVHHIWLLSIVDYLVKNK